MRVSLEQIRQQNQTDKEEFLGLTVEFQYVLDKQVQILRTSRYRDMYNLPLAIEERLTA